MHISSIGDNVPERTRQDKGFVKSISRYDIEYRNFRIAIFKDIDPDIEGSVKGYLNEANIDYSKETIRNIQNLLTECFEQERYWDNLSKEGRTILQFNIKEPLQNR